MLVEEHAVPVRPVRGGVRRHRLRHVDAPEPGVSAVSWQVRRVGAAQGAAELQRDAAGGGSARGARGVRVRHRAAASAARDARAVAARARRRRRHPARLRRPRRALHARRPRPRQGKGRQARLVVRRHARRHGRRGRAAVQGGLHEARPRARAPDVPEGSRRAEAGRRADGAARGERRGGLMVVTAIMKGLFVDGLDRWMGGWVKGGGEGIEGEKGLLGTDLLNQLTSSTYIAEMLLVLYQIVKIDMHIPRQPPRGFFFPFLVPILCNPGTLSNALGPWGRVFVPIFSWLATLTLVWPAAVLSRGLTADDAVCISS